VLRRLQSRRSRDAFVSRHPLIGLSGLVFAFGFVYDFAMEELCVRIGLYTFTQVIPFGSVFAGTRWQWPLLSSFIVMLVGVNLAFMTYGLVYTAVTRWSGAATSIVCPWPWPSAKVYDPQGFYQQSGVPGPYSEGIWSRWESAQPGGHPPVRTGHSRSC
jgi:hypothetical protein